MLQTPEIRVRSVVGGAIDSETALEEVVAVSVARAVPPDAASALSPTGAPVPVVALELEDGSVVEFPGPGFSRHHDIFSAQSQPWIAARALDRGSGYAAPRRPKSDAENAVPLPDGTVVGLRPNSKSGGATIDVKLPGGGTIKVHLP